MTRKRARGTVYQRSNNGLWIARVYAADGRPVSRSARTRAEAETLLAKLLIDPALTAPTHYTVSLWLDEYLRRANVGKAVATIHDRKHLARRITDALGSKRLDALTPAQVQRWADGLSGAHRTRMKSLQLLRSALNEALALGHIGRNPALPVKLARVSAPARKPVWTQEQARLFLEVNADIPKILLWKLALQTGARIGELLALRVHDYDPAAHTLRIERTVSMSELRGQRRGIGKTKTEAGNRTFPLPPDAETTIQAMLERRAALAAANPRDWDDQGFLFPNEQGRPNSYTITRRTFDASVRRAQAAWIRQQEQAGVTSPQPMPRITTHALRRTFISLCRRRGVQAEVVARMVGHSSPLITLRIYREVYEDEFEDARERITGLI